MTRRLAMCGIAGLFSKSLDVSESLGSHLGDMLLQLSDRDLPRRGALRIVEGLALQP
jgi:glutamate synthase domain-containing protein 1